jgi:hypothetical protein
VLRAGVSDIRVGSVGAERQSVRTIVELVGYDGNGARGRVQAVDGVAEARCGPEILPVPIKGVGEVDVVVAWVDSYVVERVELPTEIIVEENLSVSEGERQRTWREERYLWCCMVSWDS